MKIALFAPYWPPGHVSNGIVTYMSHLVPALRRQGHEVFVLTFFKGASATIRTQSTCKALRLNGLWDRAKYRLAP